VKGILMISWAMSGRGQSCFYV